MGLAVSTVEQNPFSKSQTKPIYIGTKEVLTITKLSFQELCMTSLAITKELSSLLERHFVYLDLYVSL